MNNWLETLKPGDKVVHIVRRLPWKEFKILTVERVTPSGIVKTDGGQRFKAKGPSVMGHGKTEGEIILLTPELAAEIEAREVIAKARNICYSLYRGETPLPLELAREIVKLTKNAEGD